MGDAGRGAVMRYIFIIAILFLVFGGVSARMINTNLKPSGLPQTTLAVARVPDMAPSAVHGRLVQVSADPRGHFHVDARVDGRRMDFLVDTGASVIALNETSAARLGVRPSRSEYTAKATTANGVISAAPVRFDRVEIDGVSVRDVQGMVLPDEALSENLLGMSFLSKLRRFEVAKGKLVLEQ
jgi:aspartyl protease family protein